jgi:hypothetical protein
MRPALALGRGRAIAAVANHVEEERVRNRGGDLIHVEDVRRRALDPSFHLLRQRDPVHQPWQELDGGARSGERLACDRFDIQPFDLTQIAGEEAIEQRACR